LGPAAAAAAAAEAAEAAEARKEMCVELGLLRLLSAALGALGESRKRVAVAAAGLLGALILGSEARKDAAAAEAGLVRALRGAFAAHQRLEPARAALAALALAPARRARVARLLGGREALEAVLG